MGIIELPGLLASVWTWLFIYHVIKQTQKKESIDQKAFNRRRSADKHRQLSSGLLVCSVRELKNNAPDIRTNHRLQDTGYKRGLTLSQTRVCAARWLDI
jgi:hypothetical protein